jgi:LDH2 family malate/lactate/ureidoglycolate dehydrogenase
LAKFNHGELLQFGEQILSAAGMPQKDAHLVAELLVKADLQGYPGHGITRILSYVSRIKTGLINLKQRYEVVREGKSTALINGNHYIGQVVAQDGMKLAIKKAKEHGVGLVCLRQAAHIGRLADYMELAAEEGLIGMAAVSVGSGNISLHGAMQPATGTNPMAFGIPNANGQHIIFDFATAATSMGELHNKVARKEAIPDGIMLDGYGNPTTDYGAFMGPPKGTILSFGGYKGSGINFMTEILGGILSGTGLGRQWWDQGGAATNGVFLQAFDVEEFQPLGEFCKKVDELVTFAKSRKPAPGFNEIILPGEMSRRRAEQHRKEGVEIDKEDWAKLLKCGADLGVKTSPKPL